MKWPSTNRLVIAAVFGAAILTSVVFFARFSLPGFLAGRLLDPVAAMLLVLLASHAAGKLVARNADAGDQLLLGVPLLGLVLSTLALAGLANPIAIATVTIVAAAAGAITGWREIARLIAEIRPQRILILLPPVVFALLNAITPVNTPDELTYKLAVPHLYLQFGRMLELPLNSDSYFPSAVYMADLGALVLSGGIAAKLVHFVVYLLTLRVIHRVARELTERGAMWITAVLAWTPALAAIAGWAWVEWAMIGFLLLSVLSWWRGDPVVSALALGVALSSKYTALPWALVFVAIVVWRTRGRGLLKPAAITFAAGALFYVRNLIWTGSPIAPFLLPHSPAIASYRSTLGGWAELVRGYDIFHPAIIDDALGIVLPALVLLSPLALLRRDQKIVDLILLGAVQFAGLVTLAPTSRLMILALVPLALLGGVITVRAWEESSRAIRAALAVLAAVALSAQMLLLAFLFFARSNVLPYLTGMESEQAYLERTRDFVKPYAWIEQNTREDATILMLAENRTYYLQRRALAAGNLDGPRVAAYLARFTADTLGSELQRQQVTHVLIHKPWYRVELADPHSILEKEYVLVVPRPAHEMLRTFLAQAGRKVFEDPSYVIYEIRR